MRIFLFKGINFKNNIFLSNISLQKVQLSVLNAISHIFSITFEVERDAFVERRKCL